ncbi:hypothetical protein [Kitasatospora sp. McL0602]|uniref:hypothetical protein n=1 Tax=Kitasatospora sp. McL0602 TaxID=3439530 RepID=UPI003F8A5F63
MRRTPTTAAVLAATALGSLLALAAPASAATGNDCWNTHGVIMCVNNYAVAAADPNSIPTGTYHICNSGGSTSTFSYWLRDRTTNVNYPTNRVTLSPGACTSAIVFHNTAGHPVSTYATVGSATYGTDPVSPDYLG